MNLSFIYELQKTNTIKCNINEKLINILKNYSNIIEKKLDSIFFICNGTIIDNYEKTINEIANNENKRIMKNEILVYQISEAINKDDNKNIYFLEENNTIKISCKKDDKIKNISEKYENLSNLSINL